MTGFANGKPTGNVESFRITAHTRDIGTIFIDLVQYSETMTNKFKDIWGKFITADNLINVAETNFTNTIVT